jgi:uroporphyrin-3 C-methyltransferase
MSDSNANNNPQDIATTALPVHKNPLARAISHLNLTQLTLAVLVIVFIWQWIDAKQQLNQLQQTLAQRLAESDGNSKATQTLTLQSQEQVRELGGKLSLMESRYAETQSQRTALETLYQDLSSSRDQMVLAEVEQLLLIAGQQLQLAANVKAALIAMQQADHRLQRMDRAALNGLRRAINNDMEKLRALPEIDVSSLSTKLDNLFNIINELRLLQEVSVAQEIKMPELATASDNWAYAFVHELWQDMKKLVRIENIHQKELPLLSPTQTFFLRENLKLRLLSARLALLSRDEASFKRDIKTAQEWVKLFFDIKSVEGSQALSILQKLNASNIKIDMPDVSGSLESVRHYRASREKGAR